MRTLLDDMRKSVIFIIWCQGCLFGLITYNVSIYADYAESYYKNYHSNRFNQFHPSRLGPNAIFQSFAFDSMKSPLVAYRQRFTFHHCPNLVVYCASRKGRHQIGKMEVIQLPRDIYGHVTCLPYGHIINQQIESRWVARCNVTFLYSCRRHGGCVPQVFRQLTP